MSYPAPFGPLTEHERDIVKRASSAASIAAEYASGHDRDRTFPVEGLAELARNGYLGLAAPEKLGGGHAQVSDMVLGNAVLARGDASLALVVAMHAAMDLLLFQARGLLVSTARAWDAMPSASMEAALAAAKVVATNNAVAVAEEAMRLVGGSSLDRASPLERHFRDVRGGLHHPPQDDAALALFARQALD